MGRYEIAIIGTGPAGLSAAITAKVRNKKIILFGQKNLSEKIGKAHTIANYPGLPEISGKELETAFTGHLAKMDIEITEDKINAVYPMGDYFALQGLKDLYEADTLIVASGINVTRTYPGELEYLGRGVSYCATCDAALYRGRTAAVVSFSPKEEAEAEFLAEIADRVFYFPMYAEEPRFSSKSQDKIEVIREKPVSVEGSQKADTLVTDCGRHTVDGIFFLRDTVPPSQLVPGVEMEDNHIAVNRSLETSVKGCFACGDVTGAPYQYIKAAGEGNVAALSAVAYLTKK